MILPLVACILLVGIHAYLGIHVLARKVIFVDLALAQIAALGAVYGLFIGLSFDEHPILIKLVSIIFSLLGAILISLSKVKHKLIPHEAIIGVIYATALSLLILLSANLAHGADEIRQLLSGSILWVSQKEILYTLFLYVFIGFIHFIFRKNFFALSYGVSIANKALWDFLFYATFGLVVTSSVGIGGVLLVFGYLIIPSLIGVLCAQETKNRLFCAWFFGILASVIGVSLSYEFDMPSGPSIVVILAFILLFIFLIKTFYVSKTKFFIFLFVIFLFVSIIFLINYFITPIIKISDHNLIISTDKNLIDDLMIDDSQKNLSALKLIDEKK
jgi:zinc/manganese transport system permease protein